MYVICRHIFKATSIIYEYIYIYTYIYIYVDTSLPLSLSLYIYTRIFGRALRGLDSFYALSPDMHCS